MDIRGEQVILDIKFKSFPDDLKKTIENSLLKNDINVVNYVEHLFTPQGVTACWILSASSFTIHTYPEENFIAIDCYTCSREGSAVKVINYIILFYNDNIDKIFYKKINRGEI